MQVPEFLRDIMLAKVHSGAVYGVDAYAVEIEVNTGTRTVIVGLPDAAVKESKDRVNTAPFLIPISRCRRNG